MHFLLIADTAMAQTKRKEKEKQCYLEGHTTENDVLLTGCLILLNTAKYAGLTHMGLNHHT